MKRKGRIYIICSKNPKHKQVSQNTCLCLFTHQCDSTFLFSCSDKAEASQFDVHTAWYPTLHVHTQDSPFIIYHYRTHIWNS